MRVTRLRDEADQWKWREAWNTERARPIGKRRCFSFAEVAERLVRDPDSLKTDLEFRDRIVADLGEWVQNRQFGANEVVALSGDPPRFRPFRLGRGNILVPVAEVLALQRGAVRQYVEARPELPGSAGLLRDWFGDQAEEPRAAEPGGGGSIVAASAQEQPLRGKALDDARRLGEE